MLSTLWVLATEKILPKYPKRGEFHRYLMLYQSRASMRYLAHLTSPPPTAADDMSEFVFPQENVCFQRMTWEKLCFSGWEEKKWGLLFTSQWSSKGGGWHCNCCKLLGKENWEKLGLFQNLNPKFLGSLILSFFLPGFVPLGLLSSFSYGCRYDKSIPDQVKNMFSKNTVSATLLSLGRSFYAL